MHERSHPTLPLWAAVLVATASGLVADAAYPDRGWWPFLLVGLAGLLVSLAGRTFWSGALVGLVYGFAFYLVHISWATQWVGPLPWIALSGVMAVSHAVGAGLIALAYRWLPRAWPGIAGRLVALPIAVAGLYVAREAVISIWPYGGFAWGRAGHAMIDAPVAPLYAWLGISGMTFVVVWFVAVTIEAVRMRGLDPLRRAIAPVGLATALIVWPAWPTPATGEFRVAVVQGNGPAGYFDEREAGDLLRAQYAATRPLFGEVDVDLVLWPEGSSDWDPQVEPYAAGVWDEVVEGMGAPLLGQAVTERGREYFNTAILWDAGRALDAYDKRHPVVWGEYIPDRAFFELIVPDLTSMIAREYAFGTTDAVMDVPTRGGDVRVAVNICYDIVDDALLRESVLDGGRVILASSNNADFGRTDESVQQLAFARIRAVELGRAVVNASTVGITAVIGPDGRVVDRLPWYTAGTIVTAVPLIDTVTPAAAGGRHVEFAAAGLGVALLLGARLSAVPLRAGRRRARRQALLRS